MNLAEKKVLVTGACGTIGRELLTQLLVRDEVASLTALDNNESGLFLLQEHFHEVPGFQCFLGDIRDRDKLRRRMRGIDLVFHTAAYKHVALCEQSPFEAVQTNIIGVQNIIAAAMEAGVEKVIFTSSDKAVNPTSVMGTSKLMGERLFTAANCQAGGSGTVFASTRFGNVLGSSGSVMPVFKNQIRAGGPVTVTDDQMTRFVMSVRDAVRLVIETASLAQGGEVFVTKMRAIRIPDLALVMIEELAPVFGRDPADIAIEYIGAKPGEKMYEELLSAEELRRTLEHEKYFVILPAFRDLFSKVAYEYPDFTALSGNRPYRSDQEAFLGPDDLRSYLRENSLLEPE